MINLLKVLYSYYNLIPVPVYLVAQVPVGPRSYPRLVPTGSIDGGEYQLNLSPLNAIRGRYDTTIVIKIDSGTTYFLWQVRTN